jgi:thioredoxin 1
MVKPGNGAEPMVRLNDATFPDWTERRPPLTLVLVGSQACAQSLELEPMLADAASRYSGRVRVATLDIDESPEAIKRHKVDGAPTILLFRDGKQVGRLASCRVALAELDEFITKAEKKG